MDEKRLAALKRKHDATEEPAKKAELAEKLRLAGHDPDAAEKPSESPSGAPKGRRAPEKVTAEQSKPEAKTAKDEEKPRSAGRPTRASKNAEDKGA